jgi:hypothetical protein
VHDHVLKAKTVCTGQHRLYRKDAHRLRLMEIIPLSDPISKTPVNPSHAHTSQDSIKRAGIGKGNEEWKNIGMWRGSGLGRAESVVEEGRLEDKGLGHEIGFKYFDKNG